MRLTNEELIQTYGEEKEKLEFIHTQMNEVDSRLSNLYDAIETGEFKGGELTPRIKALSRKKGGAIAGKDRRRGDFTL